MNFKALKTVGITLMLSASFSSQAAECELNTRASCESYLDTWVDSLPSATSNRYYYKRNVERKMSEMLEQVEACGFEGQNRTVERFARNRLNFFQNKMGMMLDNVAYLDRQENPRLFDSNMMQVPQTLIKTERDVVDGRHIVTDFPLKRMMEAEFKSQEWKRLEAQGYQQLIYSSRTVPNPPFSSMRRLLILVPSDAYDQWIQFTLPDVSRQGTNEALIDFIAIQKQDVNGNRLANPQIHFRQYWRNYTDSRLSSYDRNDDSEDKCYQCHASGNRRLSPDPGSVRGEEQLAVVKSFNKRMESYGNTGWAGMFFPENHGPIGQTIGCARCHGDAESTQDPLTWTFLQRGIENGINPIKHKMTQDLTMPPNVTLSAYHSMMDELAKVDFNNEMVTLRELRRANQDNKYQAAFKVLKDLGRINDEQETALNRHAKYTQEDGNDAYNTFVDLARSELATWLKQSCAN